MGVRLQRQKKRHLWQSVMYRLTKIIPLSTKGKLKFYLNMSWFFWRLSHEQSFKYYNLETHPIRKFTAAFLYQHLQPDQTVLDLGCHSGDLSYIISKKVKKVTGIDYDAGLIASAKKNFEAANIQFHHGEALDYLQGNKEKFDVLILSHILEHLDDPKGFLLKFKDFFDYIYIEVPDFDKSYLNHYRKDLEMSVIYTDADHVSEFDRVELSELLEQCNIEVEHSSYRCAVQQLWCKVRK